MRSLVAGRLLGVLVVLALAPGTVGAASVAAAQERPAGAPLRIGRLSPLSAETDAPNLAGFRAGLRDLGWIEGQRFTLVSRFADGKSERLAGLAADLVRQQVDLILTGSTPGAAAAKKATTTIPIVMVTTGDPVAGGLVASLAHPGGNVTGVTALGQVLNAKRLELIINLKTAKAIGLVIPPAVLARADRLIE